MTLALAWLWALGVIGMLVALRVWGESAILTLALLYVPRTPVLYAVPVLVALAALRRKPAALVPVALGLAACIPLLGFEVHPPQPAPSGFKLRLTTHNVWFGYLGEQGLRRELEAAKPDVVVFQATSRHLADPALRTPALQGFHYDNAAQFSIASRYRIVDSELTQEAPSRAGPPWARWTLETPAGLVDLFVIHPISPRGTVRGLLSGGVRARLRSGLSPVEIARLREDVALRRAQVDSIARAVKRAKHPVIVAGDTNLPGLSRILREQLGELRDAFSETGTGLGYTFPCDRKFLGPWLRIDRVLTGPQFRPLATQVGPRGTSTHCALTVDLELAR